MSERDPWPFLVILDASVLECNFNHINYHDIVRFSFARLLLFYVDVVVLESGFNHISCHDILLALTVIAAPLA